MSKLHKFNDSLAVGHAGEERLLAAWPELTRTDGRKHDFYDAKGKLYELKSDSFDPASTPNFFIERYSSERKKSDGGPWKSYQDGVDFWLYLFTKTGECYIMRLEPLLMWLEDNVEKYRKVYVNNSTYRTMGYLVPREDIKHLWKIKKL